MVAPGDSLEIGEMPDFRKGCGRVPGLREAVMGELRNRPMSARQVAGPIHKIEVWFEGRQYWAYLGRRRNHVGLTDVFDAAESREMGIFEAEIRERYGRLRKGR